VTEKKYNKLHEIARLSGQRIEQFIDGTAEFWNVPCDKCPAMSLPERNHCNKSCKANFLTWLFNKRYQEENESDDSGI
jgi:uncharacterized OB-fold protein